MVSSESDQLRSYTLAKQEIATLVRSVKQFLEAQQQKEKAEQCQEILVNLAEDRFNLAVVGQFKRGKSSLMNAIIGRDLLPTGLLPLTSAITTLCYGPTERVILRRKGWGLQPEVPLSELPDYVTERGNPGNEKGLIEARVELPAPFLRRGLHFIDTPGVGSAQVGNTQTTYEFLPQADAVIFVTSVEAPLSEAEQTFLRDVRQYVRKLFVVVNKTDLLAAGEQDEVLSYVQTGIERTLSADEVRLYPASARQALAAKLAGDAAGLEASGLSRLEEDLAAFLAAERGQIFLASIVDRVLRLTAGAAALESLRSDLATVRDRLIAGDLAIQIAPTPELFAANGAGATGPSALASPEDSARSEAHLSLSSATCPLCAALSQALQAYFVDLQYNLVVSPDTRQSLAEQHGLCCQHTWHFQGLASPQGISEGYVPLMAGALAVLRPLEKQQPTQAAQHLDAWLATPATCPACRLLEEVIGSQIAALLSLLATAEGRERYTRGRGLCLPHLRAVLANDLPDELAAFLVQRQVQRIEEISEDMRSYTLKREALRRGLHNRDEENAWRRALVQLVGERTALIPGKTGVKEATDAR